MDEEKQELSYILSLVPFDVVSHGTHKQGREELK